MQVCTSLQTDNHASTPPLSFLQAGCPSCRPTNSVKALKAIRGLIAWVLAVIGGAAHHAGRGQASYFGSGARPKGQSLRPKGPTVGVGPWGVGSQSSSHEPGDLYCAASPWRGPLQGFLTF